MENKLRSALIKAKIEILDQYKNCIVFEHDETPRQIETIYFKESDIPTFVNDLRCQGLNQFVLHSAKSGKLRFCTLQRENVTDDPSIRERNRLLNLLKLHKIEVCNHDFERGFANKHKYHNQLSGK